MPPQGCLLYEGSEIQACFCTLDAANDGLLPGDTSITVSPLLMQVKFALDRWLSDF